MKTAYHLLLGLGLALSLGNELYSVVWLGNVSACSVFFLAFLSLGACLAVLAFWWDESRRLLREVRRAVKDAPAGTWICVLSEYSPYFGFQKKTWCYLRPGGGRMVWKWRYRGSTQPGGEHEVPLAADVVETTRAKLVAADAFRLPDYKGDFRRDGCWGRIAISDGTRSRVVRLYPFIASLPEPYRSVVTCFPDGKPAVPGPGDDFLESRSA